MHQGYEVIYAPQYWAADRETVLHLSIGAFVGSMVAVRDKYLRDTSQEALNEEQQAEYLELMTLGPKMLELYFEYHQRYDEGLTPLGVEEDWSVPLGFAVDGVDVVFKFRTDLRVQDADGHEWLWDHKTAGKMSESVDHLTMDPQMGKYLWGLHMLGHPVVGAIYNEQYKGYPQPPAVLKQQRLGRWLSTSKSADTTYELMLKAIEEQGEDPALYEEYLEWLKSSNEVKQWIRRTQVRRNVHELNMQGQITQQIAVDMLNNPQIYPSPSRFKCNWCMVKPVCLEMFDGSDWEWTLTTNYTKVTNHYGHAV